jgi:uncharacterized protein
MTTTDPRRVIEDAFDRWTSGEGDVFDLLDDDVCWTITGTSAFAGTYNGRREFLDRTIGPLEARLADPIRPTVQSIVADGDRVVVLWHGHAVATDGESYDNSYSWHLRLKDGKIVEVTAFLDGATLDRLLERVAPE